MGREGERKGNRPVDREELEWENAQDGVKLSGEASAVVSVCRRGRERQMHLLNKTIAQIQLLQLPPPPHRPFLPLLLDPPRDGLKPRKTLDAALTKHEGLKPSTVLAEKEGLERTVRESGREQGIPKAGLGEVESLKLGEEDWEKGDKRGEGRRGCGDCQVSDGGEDAMIVRRREDEGLEGGAREGESGECGGPGLRGEVGEGDGARGEGWRRNLREVEREGARSVICVEQAGAIT